MKAPSTFYYMILSLLLSHVALSMHIYMKSGEVRCFHQNLAANTLLIGDLDIYVERDGTYVEDPNVMVHVTIDETFDNDERVLDQRNANSGDFIFTSLQAGDHKICFTPDYPHKDALLRVFIEFEVDSVRSLDSKRRDEVKSLRERVLQLISRVNNIRNEQRVIRATEVLFRDQSESLNTTVVVWIVIQLAALLATCVFQLSYLKNFFVKQKIQ